MRILLLLFLFCIDVRVKAESHKREVANAGPVYAGHTKRTYEGQGVQAIMLPESLLENREGTVHLVKGHFFLEMKEAAGFSTPFAVAKCSTDVCQAMVTRLANEVVIKVVKGEFGVRRLGDKNRYSLITGAQVTVGAVTDEGVSEMEFPQSLPWESTVKEWAQFYPGKVGEFKSVLSEFREEWKLAVEKMSRLHDEYAGRTIASHEREVAAELARKAAIEREDARLRKMFREKNNIK